MLLIKEGAPTLSLREAAREAAARFLGAPASEVALTDRQRIEGDELDIPEEDGIGVEMDVAQVPIIQNPNIHSYINQLGNSIAQRADPESVLHLVRGLVRGAVDERVERAAP